RCVAVQNAGPGSHDIFRPGYLAMFLAELGEFADAETAAESTLRSPHTTPERPWDFATASWQIGWLWGLKGDLVQAQSMVAGAVELGRQWGMRRTLGTVTSLLGHIFALAGRLPEAVDLLEEGLRETDAFETMWLRCQRLQYLGEAYLLAGRLGKAKHTADHTL